MNLWASASVLIKSSDNYHMCQHFIFYTYYKGSKSQNHILTYPSWENSIGLLFNSTQHNPCQNLKISWFPAGLMEMTEIVDSKPLLSV